MRRREFITLLGASAVAWPLSARAQQSAMPVVGFLNGASAWEYSHLADAFRQGLGETGYFENRNVAIEYRWAEGHYDRLPTLAADLVHRQVRVIAAAGGTQPAVAAKAATTTIPIVFSIGADPVQAGLVASLNRPGGNLTGWWTLAVSLGPKRLQLAHELVPAASSAVLLVNPSDAAQTDTKKAQEAARELGLQLNIVHASSERELDEAFVTVLQLRAGVVVINADAFFNSRSKQLAELALRHAVPAVYQYREVSLATGRGSLMHIVRSASIPAAFSKVINRLIYRSSNRLPPS